MTTTVSKICVICGTDTSSIRRVKDTLGRYYCQTCYAEHAAKTVQNQAKAAPIPKFTCFHCGEKFLIDDVWEENGVITCKPCYDKQLAEAKVEAETIAETEEAPKKFPCSVCSEEFAIDDCWDIDGTIICKECYGKAPVAVDAKAPADALPADLEPIAAAAPETVDDWFTPADQEAVADPVVEESADKSADEFPAPEIAESIESTESTEPESPVDEPAIAETKTPPELDLEGLPEEFAAPVKDPAADEIVDDDLIEASTSSVASPEPEVLTELPEINEPESESLASVDFDLAENSINESTEPNDAVTILETPARKSGPPTDADLLHEILDRAVTISPPSSATATHRTGESVEFRVPAEEIAAEESSTQNIAPEAPFTEESASNSSASANVEVIETIEDVEVLEPTSTAEVFDGAVPSQPTYLKPDTQFASEFPSDRIHTQSATTPFSEEPISRDTAPTAATVVPAPFEESAVAQQPAPVSAGELPAPPEGPTTVDLVVPIQSLGATSNVAENVEEEETFAVDSIATPATVLAIPPELVHAIKDYAEACIAIATCRAAYERIERVRIDLSVARNIIGLNQIIEGLNDTIAKERAALLRLIECTKVMRRYPYSEVQFARKVAMDNPILDDQEKSPLQTDPHHFFTTPW